MEGEVAELEDEVVAFWGVVIAERPAPPLPL